MKNQITVVGIGMLLIVFSLFINFVEGQESTTKNETTSANSSATMSNSEDSSSDIEVDAPPVSSWVQEILENEDYSPDKLMLIDAYLEKYPKLNRHFILPCEAIDKEELLLTKRFNNIVRLFFRMPQCEYQTGGMREIDKSFLYNGYMYRY